MAGIKATWIQIRNEAHACNAGISYQGKWADATSCLRHQGHLSGRDGSVPAIPGHSTGAVLGALADDTRHKTLVIIIILLEQLATLKIKHAGGGLIYLDKSKAAMISRHQCVFSHVTSLAKRRFLVPFRDLHNAYRVQAPPRAKVLSSLEKPMTPGTGLPTSDAPVIVLIQEGEPQHQFTGVFASTISFTSLNWDEGSWKQGGCIAAMAT